MTTDEKYNRRVNLCSKLRILDNEIEKIANIRDEYGNTNSNKKVRLSICFEGGSYQYELSDKVAVDCMQNIYNSFEMEKEDIIKTLKQELSI